MAEPVLRATPQPEEVPCANHPSRLTLVRCSNCGKPICPDCMVYSPVGVKCRECARLPKSALATLKPQRLALAVLTAFAAGTGIGFVYYLFLGRVGFFFFAFFLAAGIGALVGEAVFRASGYHHGTQTAVIAAAGTVWAFLLPPLLLNLVNFGVAWQTVVFSLTGRSIINWLVMALAAYFAWQRNR